MSTTFFARIGLILVSIVLPANATGREFHVNKPMKMYLRHNVLCIIFAAIIGFAKNTTAANTKQPTNATAAIEQLGPKVKEAFKTYFDEEYLSWKRPSILRSWAAKVNLGDVEVSFQSEVAKNLLKLKYFLLKHNNNWIPWTEKQYKEHGKSFSNNIELGKAYDAIEDKVKELWPEILNKIRSKGEKTYLECLAVAWSLKLKPTDNESNWLKSILEELYKGEELELKLHQIKENSIPDEEKGAIELVAM
ncbi:hypothetical protein DdX_01569 [Ditylenchus destructor]|uniref:Uncharacterized protein n=1 Tax=Ditylenchus destructor TaxID=166010 RepID=A0AAD4RDY3_9BILA|nr:hypothetical protein DdX_01569 [Ditylenchus destructor]